MQYKYLKAAEYIANEICRDSYRHTNCANWVGVNVNDFSQDSYFSALKGDWYSGTSGISFFLNSMYNFIPNPIYKEIALEALNTALQHDLYSSMPTNGLYSGKFGVAYAKLLSGEIHKETNVISDAIEMIVSMFIEQKHENKLDVIDGNGGLIPILLNIYERYPNKALLIILNDMITFLKDTVTKHKDCVSWDTCSGSFQHHLTGFAHGTSGIALSILEFGKFFNDISSIKLSELAFKYEENNYNEKQQNWPDLRIANDKSVLNENENFCSLAWCHGAPGNCVAFLRAYQLTRNKKYLHFGKMAFDTTLKKLNLTDIGNYSICHGLCGNADILLWANNINAQNKNAKSIINSIGDQLLDNFIKKGIPIPNGNHNDLYCPDLMIGLSGIGYFLLRLHDSTKMKFLLYPR